MSMYKRLERVEGESLDYNRHPDFEVKDTRVSDYLRKYGSGHLENAPHNPAPEVTDDRSVDEMLDSEFEPHMSTETVDVLLQIEKNKDRFEKAIKKIELSQSDKSHFEAAVKVLNDSNSDYDARREAYSILEELYQKGSVTRARKT